MRARRGSLPSTSACSRTDVADDGSAMCWMLAPRWLSASNVIVVSASVLGGANDVVMR